MQGGAADIYFPLAALQELSGRTGRINTVLVKTDSAADVESVAAAIRKEFPDAQVVTTASLAAQVTGSLKDTKKLADRFGGVLAVLVLGAAFAIAALLTLGSVGKRVREIGTLRAVGWPRRLVVRQILVETLGISALGAVLGVGLGLVAGAAIGQFSPTLSATVPTVDGSARLLQSVGTGGGRHRHHEHAAPDGSGRRDHHRARRLPRTAGRRARRRDRRRHAPPDSSPP